MRRVIRKHLRDFVAVMALFLIALAVAGYILGQERLNLPGWVPIVGKSFYTVNAEFSSGQALTAGEGQTVDIAGVPVGEIGSVQLKDGKALVQLKIRKKYSPIYRDATMVLRPKTSLKDMTIEMDPGTRAAGKLPDGGTIPVYNTNPDVNLDEILSSLDADTRSYLQLLVNGAGRAFSTTGNTAEPVQSQSQTADLRQTFKRFEPTNRDLARITGQLSTRRRNIANVVHNLHQLTQELGTKDSQIASLVDSSNANFRALASEDARIRESLQLLPGTLSTAQSTLTKADAFASHLGPTLQSLRPTARALGPALAATRPFLHDTTPIIQNHLRPFARTARPVVKDLRRAASTVGPVTPRLTRVFRVVNAALNELAFNPPKSKGNSFLFWNAWVSHDGASVFSTQDAHGPIRRGLVVASCQSLELTEQLIQTNPQLRILTELLNPARSSDVCPKQTPSSPKAAAKSTTGGGR